MLSRGIIIGKIVDDLAILKYQVEARNKLKQFDLTKICEDFFKEVLNIVYDLSLLNLNADRDNNPGLDLGDKSAGIAYQVTSQATSAKINDTLRAIIPAQKADFPRIKVFIVGEKQKTNSGLDGTLCDPFSFTAADIEDIDSLLKQIVVLDIAMLDSLHELFRREFRRVKIELEPVDSEGAFESSLYHIVEQRPASPPKNALKFLEKPEDPKDEDSWFKKIRKLYKRLASVPRSTREVLSIFIERAEYRGFWGRKKFVLLPKVLEKLLRLSEAELMAEIDILHEAGLLDIEEEGDERPKYFLVLHGQMENYLFAWILDESGIPLRKLLASMDFTALDK